MYSADTRVVLNSTSVCLQVLVSTATLAWGVNLPAHMVIIKGTQVRPQTCGTMPLVLLSPACQARCHGRELCCRAA
jgi:hypothetical protein